MVFQDDALLPWQNVEENIGFGLTLAGVPKAKRAATVAALLELTGLAGYARYPLWKISGGMRQRWGWPARLPWIRVFFSSMNLWEHSIPPRD